MQDRETILSKPFNFSCDKTISYRRNSCTSITWRKTETEISNKKRLDFSFLLNWENPENLFMLCMAPILYLTQN